METIKEAKDYLRENFDEGAECPCCKQNVKLYRRIITSTMARQLIALSNLTIEDRHKALSRKYNPEFTSAQFYHITEVLDASNTYGGGDFAKLRWWGLVEEQPNDDEKKRTSGYWAITPKGSGFVDKTLTVPKNVYVYNNKLVSKRTLGDSPIETVGIKDVLGNKFDYSVLMSK